MFKEIIREKLNENANLSQLDELTGKGQLDNIKNHYINKKVEHLSKASAYKKSAKLKREAGIKDDRLMVGNPYDDDRMAKNHENDEEFYNNKAERASNLSSILKKKNGYKSILNSLKKNKYNNLGDNMTNHKGSHLINDE